MKTPSLADIRRFTGEPFISFDEAFIAAFLSPDYSEEGVSRWHNDPTIFCGSRLGLAGFWELCNIRGREGCHPSHFAAVSSSLWRDGRRSHAIVEFGIGSPQDLIEAMTPFAGSKIIMKPEDQAAFAQMADLIPAYRGGEDTPDLALGCSWTTDLAVAESFASRATNGTVVEKLIHKRMVVAYFGATECELVVGFGAALESQLAEGEQRVGRSG